jgi:hypothetical protein
MCKPQSNPDIRKGWPRYWNEPRTIFERRDGSGNWPGWIEHIDHQRIGGGKGAARGVRPTNIYQAQPYHGTPYRRDIAYLRSLGWRVTMSKKRA